MNIESAFPSKYLKASDLGEKAPVVTIARVAFETVGKTKEMKPIVYFEDKDKGLVLNKTNARKIIELTGSKDTEDWTGCRIRLYATETPMGDEIVDCIRIKAATAVEKPKPVAVPVDDDDSGIPF